MTKFMSGSLALATLISFSIQAAETPSPADAYQLSAQQAVRERMAAVEAGKQSDGSQSSAAGKTVGIEARNSARVLATQSERQASDLQTQITDTQAALDKCTKEGEAALAAAQAALAAAQAAAAQCASETTTSSDGSESPKDCSKENAAVTAAQNEVNKITTALKVDCKDPLNKLIGQLKAMKGVAARAAASSRVTESLSSGSGGGDKKPDPKKPDEPTPGTIDCTKVADAPANPKCDAHFLKVCPTMLEDAKCATFSTRYCRLEEQVAIRPGETTPAFCKKARPYYFCTPAATETANCLTCRDLQNTMNDIATSYSTEQLVANYLSCDRDPLYLDQLILNNVMNNLPTPSTTYSTQSLPKLPPLRKPASNAK